ncbi:MAG TPA: tetratricopeptide repeat protein [Planctomycetota bacterium]|nr:tetratricopeptide repeat protein [Planctomycetota bacterium]
MKVARLIACIVAGVCVLTVSVAFPAENQDAAKPAAAKPEPPADQNPRYFTDLAGVNLRYGQNEKAVELFQKALELQGGDSIDANIAFGMGKAYLALKQTDKAQAILETPLATMEADRQAQYIMAVARLYKTAEMYEKAEKMLLKAKDDITNERDQTMIIQQLLELYKSTPLGQQATAAYEKRLADNPKDSEAIKGLMDLYLYDSKLEKAAELAARYAELHPDDVSALRDLAFFYIASNDLDKTVDVTVTLIEKDPENKAEYYSRIIYIYNEQNRLDKVEEWADKAEKGKIRSDATYEALADAYVKAKQLDKAENCFKKALAANPGSIRSKISYARLLIELNKLDEARKLLEPLEKTDDPHLKTQVQGLLLQAYKGAEKAKDEK